MRIRRMIALAVWLVLTVCAGAWGDVAIDETNFPDSVFRSYVKNNFDTDSDDVLSDAEISAVTSIDIDQRGIYSLKGIKHFTAITYLSCIGNYILSLDVSGNTALKTLVCDSQYPYDDTGMISLDVSGCTALERLYCYGNSLTALDVSGCTALSEFNCYHNALTTLDVSSCPALDFLFCRDNALTELDVSSNTALRYLYCADNKITSLNLSNNPSINDLDCSYNPLGSLDVSVLTWLYWLSCESCDLTALDVSSNSHLESLRCGYDHLTELNLSNNPELRRLYCYSTDITALDFSSNPKLRVCSLSDMPGITALDFSSNPQLRYLELVLCNGLVSLDCANAQLTALDIDSYWCPSLAAVNCGNQVVSLDENAITSNASADWPYKFDVNRAQISYDINPSFARTTDATMTEWTISNLSVKDESGDEVNVNARITYSTSTLYFSAKPKTMSYTYKTGYSGSGGSMDVVIRFGAASSGTTGGVAIDETNFPDDVFRAYVASADVSFDKNQDGYLSDEEIAAVTTISVGNMGISSLTGVEYFTALTWLHCPSNPLTSLDVSRNTALMNLECWDNQFTDLDVSKNTALVKLVCGGNRLMTGKLDLSGHTALTELYCAGSQLTSLDLSGCSALVNVECNGNQLTGVLNLSGGSALTFLNCNYNQLDILDVSGCTALLNLHCAYNNITALDISDCTSLNELRCHNNQLTALDVRNTPAITDLYCENNLITVLDLTNNPALTCLNCMDNQLASLDISQNTELTELYCQNYLYPHATDLVDRTNNHITVLNVSNNKKLTRLFCGWNQLTSLDVSKNTALTGLHSDGNPLKTLDVSHNENLTELYCGGNQLTSLDVSRNTALISLDCWSNELTTLDISRNTALSSLECQNNQLTELNITQNKDLAQLRCYNNQLTVIDVSGCESLDTLYCFSQTVSVTSPDTTGDSSYPYSLKFSALSTSLDISRVYSLDVRDYYGNTVNFVTDTSASAQEWMFNAKPKTMTYYYYTGHSGSYMDVTATLAGDAEALLTLTASSTDLNIALGQSATITLTASGIQGTASYTADAPAEAGLTLSGNTATFSPTASGTYTVTFTVTDSGRESGSNSASVTVSLTVSIPSSWTALTESNFPDSAFRSYLTENYDSDGDGYISDIDSITQLELSGLGIADLTGIEHFTGITYLDCSGNSLTGKLDLNANSALVYLNCSNNSLTALDVTGCLLLEYLDCWGNELETLDVTNNTALTELFCGRNKLTELDVSKNTALTELLCNYSRLTALDVSNNTALEFLDFGSNDVKQLDVSKNTALKQLVFGENKLTALDVSNNTALEYFDYSDNQIAAMDLSNNTALGGLLCVSQALTLTALDTTGRLALPYSISLNTAKSALGLSIDIADFAANVLSLDIVDSSDTHINHSTDITAGTVYFAAKPRTISYIYNTGYHGSSDSMDVTVTISSDIQAPPFSVILTPSSQTITQGDSITAITLSTVMGSGDISYTAASLPAGLTLSGDRITGAVSTVGAYTFTVTATDAEGSTATATGTITVNSPYVDPAGISGISITSPAAKSITLSADGGTFSAALSASGTPYGSIVWTASATQGLSADISGSGSTATLSGTAQPNTSSQDISGTITVTAHDDTGTNYSDTLTVIVSGLTQSIDITSKDPSPDITTITGIAFTPETLTLSADGGQANFTASVQGTPSGDVTWSVSPETYTLSPQTGSSVNITGSVPANTTSDGIPYTVRVSARDSVSTVSADFSVIVAGRKSSGEHQDPSKDERPYYEKYTGDSWSDAYVLGSYSDLMDLVSRFLNGSESAGKYYSINADLDLSAVGNFQSIGSESNPFRGHFDGGGNTITIPANSRGLFGLVDTDGIAIQNLSVRTAPSFYNGASAGTPPTDYAGGIVQELLNGTITGCTFTGTVTADGADSSAGGIVGLLSGGTVQNCRVLSGSGVYASHSAGGIVGYVMAGTISDCTSDADVDAEFSGGIAGYTEAERQNLTGNSYTAVTVEVGNDILSIELLPNMQTVSAGAAITDIQVSSDNAASWSFRVSGDYALGLTSRDMVISGTIPAGTQEGTYTVTVDALNTNGFTASAQAYITVTGAIIPTPEVFTIELLPDMQTVSAGAAITDIQVSSDNTAVWSFRVSGDYALGLTSRDMVISGTIPAGTQEGTYTVTVDALNTNGFTASAQAYITVTGSITSDDPRPTPPTPARRENSVDYAFDIPTAVRDRMAMLFGGESVYQFTDDEIISGLWELDEADTRAIENLYEKVVLHLPVLMPKNSGLYMLRLNLSETGAGKKISLYGITSGGGNISATALEDLEYILLDEEGNEISEVPENGIVYAALRLTANREHKGVITSPIELEQGTIQPVEPDETLLEKIADTVQISADRIMFITEENISDPQEPTDAIRTELHTRQNEILGKFNTITVDKTGYYVLKVTLSDDLYERVKGVSINELKVYALHDDGRTSSADVSASFITGLLNTWELLTLNGEKLEFGVKEFLMVGFLNAGTPFSVYLTKMIIMLLLGGCDSGLGIAGFGVMALGAVFLIIRRKL